MPEATPTATPEPRLVNPKQAAEILGISRATVYELISSGRLPSVKVMRCRRVRLSDVERIVAGGVE